MPRISAKKSQENIIRSEQGVASVDKALSLLKLFTGTQKTLSLTQMAEVTGLYKSSVLRLLYSLETAALIRKNQQGSYELGPLVAHLYRQYHTNNPLEKILMPALEELTQKTQESAAFHIRHGSQRMCLFRVDSNQALRDHIQIGDLLPIEYGAGGKVILAFEGQTGKLYDKIRQDKVIAIQGDRVKEISGISAPVFNQNTELVGVITLTMPTYRFTQDHIPIVKSIAQEVTQALGGNSSP